jgi:hypothetical protein
MGRPRIARGLAVPPMVVQKTIPTRDERAKGIYSVVLWDDRVRSSDRDWVFYGEDL